MIRRMSPVTSWIRLAVLTSAVAVFGACSLPLDQSSAAACRGGADDARLSLVVSPRFGHWARYRVEDGRRAVDVYIAHDSRPKPVVILLHGSGCAPLMTVDANGTFHDTSLFQDLIALG